MTMSDGITSCPESLPESNGRMHVTHSFQSSLSSQDLLPFSLKKNKTFIYLAVLFLVVACGIWFPDKGSNLRLLLIPLHWELGVSATVPPGKSPHWNWKQSLQVTAALGLGAEPIGDLSEDLP